MVVRKVEAVRLPVESPCRPRAACPRSRFQARVLPAGLLLQVVGREVELLPGGCSKARGAFASLSRSARRKASGWSHRERRRWAIEAPDTRQPSARLRVAGPPRDLRRRSWGRDRRRRSHRTSRDRRCRSPLRAPTRVCACTPRRGHGRGCFRSGSAHTKRRSPPAPDTGHIPLLVDASGHCADWERPLRLHEKGARYQVQFAYKPATDPAGTPAQLASWPREPRARLTKIS